jgi:hypothetical protein
MTGSNVEVDKPQKEEEERRSADGSAVWCKGRPGNNSKCYQPFSDLSNINVTRFTALSKHGAGRRAVYSKYHSRQVRSVGNLLASLKSNDFPFSIGKQQQMIRSECGTALLYINVSISGTVIKN